ncbi:MAG: hypothetical protein HZC12_08345 [Nitrospirae bacterium]|nr:hypothetical protein [Nitrospirota bacterium]
MVCLDYLAQDLRCLRGIPVTPRFSKFFCEARPEKCPLIVREKTISKDIGARRAKPFKNIWRRP